MLLQIWHFAGLAAIVALIIWIGLYSGKRAATSGDFATGGGQAGPLMVSGIIMGSLVSSQATIGTAQLAFHYGLSAWWFTLGSAIGCLVLGLVYVRPLRDSGQTTLLRIVSNRYGAMSGRLGSVLSAVGIFISVLTQVLAGMGLIATMFPVNTVAAAAITIALMVVYVLFGGAWGAGMGGVAKLILLYLAGIFGMIVVLLQSGGISGLAEELKEMLNGTNLGEIQEMLGYSAIAEADDMRARFFSLTARGAMKDIGSGVSLLLGVLSTQTYAQAIWAAKNVKSAKTGALLSAALIPPIGLAGISIGLFMRSHYILRAEVDALTAAGMTAPDLPILESTLQVFPVFAANHLPAIVGGIVLGTLLITVVGGGAGLSLGVSTIVTRDVLGRNSATEQKKESKVFRGALLCVLIVAGVAAVSVPGALINDFGFLSMALRGAVVFIPVTFALFFRNKINGKWMCAAIVVGPLTVVVGKIVKLPLDPLFVGIIIALVLAILGIVQTNSDKE